MLQRRPGLRLAISLTTGVLLLLSTSRASWLATSIDMLLVLMLSGGQRKFVLTSLTVLVIATVAVLQTSEGAFLEGWFQRTFSPDRTLLQKTSGRSDQWLLFPVVMSHAPLWGFGPGTGKDVYAHYSLLDPNIKFSKGDEMAWHSLYLQVGVEVGFIGLAVVIVLLGRIVWMTYRHWSRTGELVPLLGITSFLVVAGTVSGMDPFAGMFLGLAFLASRPRTRRRRNRRPKARVRPTVPKRAMAAQT